MGNLPKTYSIGNVTSELNRCEAANDTMDSHQTLELIAALYDLTDGDLNLGLVLKFSWKQILLIPLNGNNMLVPSLKYRSAVMTEKNQHTVSRFLCSPNPRQDFSGALSFLASPFLPPSLPTLPLFFSPSFLLSLCFLFLFFLLKFLSLASRYLQEENLFEVVNFWLCGLLFKYLGHSLLKHLG